MIDFFKGLSRGAQIGLIAGVVLIAGGTIAAAWMVSTPRHGVLFTDLRDTDAAEIAQQLDEWKVPYDLADGGGTLTVDAGQVHATRLRLVSAGVPSGGRVGFELFTDSNFGVTDFAQRVNYQRALQGELERTIASFAAVERARVHLNLQQASGLLRKEQPATASVALALRPQMQLTPQQVRGIQNLVAAAVEGLDPATVVVLDEQGGSLAADDDTAAANSLTSRLAEQANIEEHVRARVAGLLDRVFAISDYRISVDVQLNLDRVSRETETVRPQGTDGAGIVLREKRTGAQAAPTPNAPQPRDRSQQTEVEYLHGREREQVIAAPGRIEQLSVAVVVPATIDQATQDKLRDLISAAVGLNAERGDRIEVVALIGPRAADDVEATTDTAVERETDATASPSLPARTAPRSSLGPREVIALGVVALLALVVGAAIGRISRRRGSMTASERERALAQIQAWLAQESAR